MPTAHRVVHLEVDALSLVFIEEVVRILAEAQVQVEAASKSRALQCVAIRSRNLR